MIEYIFHLAVILLFFIMLGLAYFVANGIGNFLVSILELLFGKMQDE